MTSDYQSGASAMREMAAKIADKGSIRYRNGPNSPKGFDVLNRGRTNGSEETAGEIAEAIRASPLPADPASGEVADTDIDGPPDFATWRDAYEDLLVHSEADRAETATLRAALEKIADTSNWSTDQKVQIAVDALANLKAPTP